MTLKNNLKNDFVLKFLIIENMCFDRYTHHVIDPQNIDYHIEFIGLVADLLMDH